MNNSKLQECFINGIQYKCRTCFDPGQAVYPLANECSDGKAWRDLLRDIAQLQTDDNDFLPKTVCNKCLDKLINFYDFILQIHRVDKKYAELLGTYSDPLHLKVQDEIIKIEDSTVNISLEQPILEIKLENELVVPFDVVLTSYSKKTEQDEEKNEIKAENHETTPMELESLCDDNFNDKHDYSFSSSDESENLSLNAFEKEEGCHFENDSEESSSWNGKKVPIGKAFNNRFVCLICQSTFSLKGSCYRHINIAHINKSIKCDFCEKEFKCKNYLKRHVRRIHPNTLLAKSIRCGFCELSFDKLRSLHEHMKIHADGKTDIDFENCLYIKTFKSLKPLDYQLLQQQIQEAYNKCQISIFYQATDKYGNELDISDSDSDTEDTNVGKSKSYMCEICKEQFKRRKLLLIHQQKSHNDITLPYKCMVCNLPFVSYHLLQKHLKRDCWNEYRRLRSDKCNDRFIWPSNLSKHKELKHNVLTESSDDKNISSNGELAEVDYLLEQPSTDDRIYYCLMCPTTFFEVESFYNHLSSHLVAPDAFMTVESIINSTWWPNGDKQIVCKICNLSFKYIADLRKHYNNSSCAKNKRHSLKNYSITNQNGFELHLEFDSETDEEAEDIVTMYPYKCIICNKTFKRKYQLAQHQRSNHNYELLVLKCDLCVFKTVSEKVLDYHKVTQCFNAEKEFKCEQCHFKFMWQENLDKHILKFHTSNHLEKASIPCTSTKGEKIHILSITCANNKQSDGPNNSKKSINNDVPSSSSNLNAAKESTIMTEKPFKCNLCTSSYKCAEALNDHKRAKHLHENPFQCNLCDKSFKGLAALKVHKNKHINIFNCEVCSTNFSSAQFLKEHRELMGHNLSKSSGRRKTLCPICGLSVSSFTRHMQTHGGKKQFKCDLCNVGFTTKHELIDHIKTHVKERPHKCTLCDKSFVSKTKLRYHFRVHTGERPYQCQFCQKRFRTHCDIKIHVRTHTGERNFKCEICGEAFSCSAYLKKHRISKHEIKNK